MGEKLTAKFSQDNQPDLGLNIFRVEKGSVVKERKAQDGTDKNGWEYKVQFVQEGGGADGARHFESYYTKKNDGGVNKFSLNLMFGLLVKLGLYKESDDVDSDMFESETFAKKFEQLGNKPRKVGIDIATRKDKKSGNERLVSKEFYTVDEAKAKLSKRGTVAISKEAPKPEEVKASDGWED